MTSNETSQRLANESTAMETIDLALLEKICEEAMEMTIREALLHSVDPKVKKDLIEGQFKLTPGEVRGLEIYCEALIGNLVTESIESLNNRNNGRSRRNPLKTNTAKDLSEVDLEILTRNCERILEAIITESLQDSSRILSSESVDSKTMISLEEMQAEEIVSTLVDFQGSKKVQRYIGHLTADIVKTALSNVAVTMAACKKQRNVEDAYSEVTRTFGTCDTNGDHSKLTDCLQRPAERHQMVSYFNGIGSESFHKKQTDDYFSDSDIEGQKVDYSCHGDQMGFSSLEYDSEWEHQHGLSTQLHDSIGEGKKQRILLQELSFDETVEVKGSELMAPVFLAIAEEDLYDDDEEFQHMRRKAQSIEDLCHILKDEEISDSRPRSISLQNLNRVKDFTPFRFPTEESAPVKTLSSSLSDVEVEFDESDSMNDASDGEDEYFYSDGEGEGEGNVSRGPHLIPQTGDLKEYRWHTVTLAGREKVLDLKALEPYMKVITHGGYYKKAEKSVIVVITACYLPGRNHPKYQFLMEQLFFYVMSTIELLATSTDYYIVYLNGGTTQKNTPSVNWMKKFYQYIDRHQRKNMLRMFVVHPTFWLKALIRLAKAFMSPQFWQKLDFVHSLRELAEHVPLDYMFIPDEVVRSDPLYRQQHGI